MARTDSGCRQNHAITPNPHLSIVKVVGSLPGMIRRYALNDEQIVLAMLRHNHMIDVFTQAVCYPLQSCFRTFLPGIGEVETDEIYIGVGTTGGHFVFPIQASGVEGNIGTIQVEQDLALCQAKFPTLRCRPIAAQFVEDDLVALFEFQISEGEISIKEERHYRLVPNDDLTDEELIGYRS